MGEAGPNHTDSNRSIDDLFQLLVRVHDIPLAKAKNEIWEKLKNNQLQCDYHIRGGARKTRPMREATPEERGWLDPLNAQLARKGLARRNAQEEMDRATAFLYEHAPPEGIKARVGYQSWDGVFRLRITEDNEHLVIEPNCSLEYPWDAYSFTIANWSLVNELWRPRVMTFVPPAAPVMEASSPTAPAVVAPAVAAPAVEAPTYRSTVQEVANLTRPAELGWCRQSREGRVSRRW